MKFNFKEYEIQDLTYKGPKRRRYDDLIEKYEISLKLKYIALRR